MNVCQTLLNWITFYREQYGRTPPQEETENTPAEVKARNFFCGFTNRHNLQPEQTALLSAAVQDAVYHGTQACNIQNYPKHLERDAGERVEQIARLFGWSVTWPGLYPVYQTKDGEMIYETPTVKAFED